MLGAHGVHISIIGTPYMLGAHGVHIYHGHLLSARSHGVHPLTARNLITTTTTRSTGVDVILDQLRRRWANIGSTWGMHIYPMINTTHSPDTGTMLGQRLRPWANTVAASRERLVFDAIRWPDAGLLSGQRRRRWTNIGTTLGTNPSPASKSYTTRRCNNVDLMLASVADVGPTLGRHWEWTLHMRVNHILRDVCNNIDLMLARVADVGPTLGQQVLFIGICLSKHETCTRCWFNVGPPFKTLAQH